MTRISFRMLDGSVRTVDGVDGESLMRTAVGNDVSDLVGECGGELSCATCHVYVDEKFADRLAPPSQEESDLLEVMDTCRPNSRLGCQIDVSSRIEGMEVLIAPSL